MLKSAKVANQFLGKVVEGMVFRTVRCCKLCRYGSNTENPLYGSAVHGGDNPCIQWLYGTSTDPETDYCHPCFCTFETAGFKAEYGSIKKYHQEAKSNKGMIDGFMSARRTYHSHQCIRACYHMPSFGVTLVLQEALASEAK